MPGCKSVRYSPTSLVLTVWTAPVALLVIVTSADLITAWFLSVTVPCRVAFAVACPNKGVVLSRTKQLMTAKHNHLLLFMYLSLENWGKISALFLALSKFS